MAVYTYVGKINKWKDRLFEPSTRAGPTVVMTLQWALGGSVGMTYSSYHY